MALNVHTVHCINSRFNSVLAPCYLVTCCRKTFAGVCAVLYRLYLEEGMDPDQAALFAARDTCRNGYYPCGE